MFKIVSATAAVQPSTVIQRLFTKRRPMMRFELVNHTRGTMDSGSAIDRNTWVSTSSTSSMCSDPPKAIDHQGPGHLLIDLVKQALRMRPDRLVVGEVRGPELCDLLTAMNTGHEGGCGTVHANSVTDVPARLEALAALGGMGRAACHAQMASALDAIVHLTRDRNGRRGVAQVGVLSVADDGRVTIDEALRGEPGAASVPTAAWPRLAALAGLSS